MTTWLVWILIAAVLAIGVGTAFALVLVIWRASSARLEPVDEPTRTRTSSLDEE